MGENSAQMLDFFLKNLNLLVSFFEKSTIIKFFNFLGLDFYEPLEGDTSIMTYRGHSVLQTLCRCHFSPLETTGQRYIYTGCAAGRVIGKD